MNKSSALLSAAGLLAATYTASAQHLARTPGQLGQAALRTAEMTRAATPRPELMPAVFRIYTPLDAEMDSMTDEARGAIKVQASSWKA